MIKLLPVTFLAAATLLPKSCQVSFGSGSTDPSAPSSYTLGVPYFAQEEELSCGPASIQMWAAYDGVTTTQQEIGAYIGCGANGSTSAGQIVSGVQHFTTSGRDAALQYNGGEGDVTQIGEVFYSSEITSIVALVPGIAIVNGGLHAVVILGGQWHIDTGNNLYVWDTVIYNDPAVGPGRIIDAASWTGYDDTQHILSASASADGYDNYVNYYNRVSVRGASGVGGGPLPY